MLSSHINNINIQHDWNVGIKESDTEKFWVSCKMKENSTSCHGDITYNAIQKQPQQCGKFTIEKSNLQSISITCEDGIAKCTTTFLAPYMFMKLHDKSIHCMDISPSGGLGVCSAGDGKMWIWDTANGEIRRILDGHIGDIYSCRFFPSGVVVLSGGADLKLKIWSIQDGSCARTLTGHKRVINDTAIVERGRNIISVASDGLAKLWDCGSSKCLSDLISLNTAINSCSLGISHEQHSAQTIEIECGTSGKVLLLACENGMAYAVDVASRKQVFTKQIGGALNCCTFLDNNVVACGSDKGEIIMIDLRNTRSDFKTVSFSLSPVVSMTSTDLRCIAGCGAYESLKVVMKHEITLSAEYHHNPKPFTDGSCHLFSTEDASNGLVKCTGSNLDAINSVQALENVVYTTCKDGIVRMYNLQHVV